MLYTDTSYSAPFAKDPAVIRFRGRYFLYYTVRKSQSLIGIGIAVSDDLESWERVGELEPLRDYERNGTGAPAAEIIGGRLHLFYQTYGNREHDAISHAVSDDGVNFERLGIVFSPHGDWNCGRAIDADVCRFGGKLFLYCATRSVDYRLQFITVAAAEMSGGRLGRFVQQKDAPVLFPELEWEGRCIEAPATICCGGRIFMFYGGSYNCSPQQIGCAYSTDGVTFSRLSSKPFLPCGERGDWNSDESGHPYVFADDDGRIYLFYQGTNDRGRSWYLSKREIVFDAGIPKLAAQRG